jgi:hypothetical protein
MQLEGLDQLKNQITSRIEPAILRLVVQCLNQLRYRQPKAFAVSLYIMNCETVWWIVGIAPSFLIFWTRRRYV